MRGLAFFVGCFLFSFSAISAEAIQIDVAKTVVSSQKMLVIKTLSEDDGYSEMTQQARVDVMSRLERISELLPDGKNIAALSGEQRQKVELDQEAINAMLAKAFRDSRLVCTKEAKLGSNMMKRVCKTAAARGRDNDISRTNGIKVGQ